MKKIIFSAVVFFFFSVTVFAQRSLSVVFNNTPSIEFTSGKLKVAAPQLNYIFVEGRFTAFDLELIKLELAAGVAIAKKSNPIFVAAPITIGSERWSFEAKPWGNADGGRGIAYRLTIKRNAMNFQGIWRDPQVGTGFGVTLNFAERQKRPRRSKTYYASL